MNHSEWDVNCIWPLTTFPPELTTKSDVREKITIIIFYFEIIMVVVGVPMFKLFCLFLLFLALLWLWHVQLQIWYTYRNTAYYYRFQPHRHVLWSCNIQEFLSFRFVLQLNEQALVVMSTIRLNHLIIRFSEHISIKKSGIWMCTKMHSGYGH
jgi:hypothetical protein